MATYRPEQRLAVTLAGRYNGMTYTTLDNADVNSNSYQGFGEWFVVDSRVWYALTPHVEAAPGADNLPDGKYFLFHPFPQRTFTGTLSFGF